MKKLSFHIILLPAWIRRTHYLQVAYELLSLLTHIDTMVRKQFDFEDDA